MGLCFEYDVQGGQIYVINLYYISLPNKEIIIILIYC